MERIESWNSFSLKGEGPLVGQARPECWDGGGNIGTCKKYRKNVTYYRILHQRVAE